MAKLDSTTVYGDLTITQKVLATLAEIRETLNVGDGTTDSKIIIKKADNEYADHIEFYNGTTQVGEIGVLDNDYLRINQHTAKNIYTPRYIRADGGFFVDGTSKGVDGSGNFVGGTITGASDANVSNWNTAYSHAGIVTGNPHVISYADLDGSIPTWNQSTTGNAATATKLATARTIAGVSFDGSANISLNNNAITNGAGYITATLTTEQVQDIAGGMINVTGAQSGMGVTYNDTNGTIDFDLSHTHSYDNYSSWTFQALTAADASIGSSSITSGDAARLKEGTSIDLTWADDTITINHDDTSTLSGSYGSTADGTKIDNITVDAQGHVTAITTGSTGSTSTSGTVTSVTAGNGMTQSGTSTINPTLDVVSHVGTAGSIGTLNVSGDALGVNLGSTSTTACAGNDSRLSDARTPTSHVHGQISNTGAIGTTANLPLITTTSGVVTVGAFGTGSTNFAAGNHAHAYSAITGTHGNEDHSSTFITTSGVTYEALNGNSDVGTGAAQVAAGNHTHSYMSDLVNDTTPQLGGNLDMNGKDILLTAANPSFKVRGQDSTGTSYLAFFGDSSDTYNELECILDDNSPDEFGRTRFYMSPEEGISFTAYNYARTEYTQMYFGTNGTGLYVVQSGTPVLRTKDANVGIGELNPETLLEMSSTTPYLTLHNTTHEDTFKGRESKILFKGEQSGGEESTLASIEAHHAGSMDDKLGEIIISANDGSDVGDVLTGGMIAARNGDVILGVGTKIGVQVFDNFIVYFGDSGGDSNGIMMEIDDTNQRVMIGDAYDVRNSTKITIDDDAQQITLSKKAVLSSIAAASSDLDKFLVSDGGEVKYRTGAQVLSDIGATNTWRGIDSSPEESQDAESISSGWAFNHVDAHPLPTDRDSRNQVAGTYVTSVAGGTGLTSSGGTTPSLSHDSHSGEVTGSTALTIADNVVDEANMKISNAPVNDYVLTADSGATGGWKWALAGGSDNDLTIPTAANGYAGLTTDDLQAGETLVFGNLVYMKSDGKLWKCDKDSLASTYCVGICVNSSTVYANGYPIVLSHGYIRKDTWTAGDRAYVGDSGLLTNAPPSTSGDYVNLVGIAVSSTVLQINISNVVIAV